MTCTLVMESVSVSNDDMQKYIRRSFVYDCVIVANVCHSKLYTVPEEKNCLHDKQQILTFSGITVTGQKDIVDFTQLNDDSLGHLHRQAKFRCKNFEAIKDPADYEDAKIQPGIYKFNVARMDYFNSDQVNNSTVQFVGNSYEQVMVDKNVQRGGIFIMSLCNYTCIYKCCEPRIQLENELGSRILHEIFSRSNAHIDFVLKVVTQSNLRQYAITSEDIQDDTLDENFKIDEDEISSFFIGN